MRNCLLASILMLVVALVVTGCPRTPVGPEAEFRSNVSSGAAPLTVEFTDLSTAGDSPITSWLWNFGDGNKTTSTQQNPSHRYTAVGNYSVSLTVVTADGEDTETKSNFISVTQGSDGTILLPGGVPLDMVWIPAGTFLMGRSAGEQDSSSNEDPQHSVTLSGFWMGKYELTKAQWTAVMGTTPWAGQPNVLDDPNSPAMYISWNMIAGPGGFIETLNTANPGMNFRLPSEAQWEYACRAGTTTRFYWGDDPNYAMIGGYAWYRENCSNEIYAHVVGQKLPNAFGLYDMSGNVWEWCQDYWHDNYMGAPSDGNAWESPSSSTRVHRGGSWGNLADISCRSAYRSNDNPVVACNDYGFRLVRTP